MKKKNMPVLIVIGLLVLFGVLYYIMSNPAPEAVMTTPTPTPVVTTSAPAPTATLYSNPQVGFSIMKPVDWSVSDADDFHVVFMNNGAVSDETNRESTVTVTVNSNIITLAALKDAEMKQHVNDDPMLVTFKDAALAGSPAFIEVYEGMAPTDVLYSVYNGRIYKLTGDIADEAAMHQGTLQFKFLK